MAPGSFAHLRLGLCDRSDVNLLEQEIAAAMIQLQSGLHLAPPPAIPGAPHLHKSSPQGSAHFASHFIERWTSATPWTRWIIDEIRMVSLRWRNLDFELVQVHA